MPITTAQINTAILTTLSAAAALVRSQDYDELTEGMQDTPALQVYFETHEGDSVNTTTHQSTFGGGVQQVTMTFHADVYANQRSNIGEDMSRLYTVVDQIIDILQAQKHKPYFGLAGIQAFHWSAQRVVFAYGQVDYVGTRFVITVRIF